MKRPTKGDNDTLAVLYLKHRIFNLKVDGEIGLSLFTAWDRDNGVLFLINLEVCHYRRFEYIVSVRVFTKRYTRSLPSLWGGSDKQNSIRMTSSFVHNTLQWLTL